MAIDYTSLANSLISVVGAIVVAILPLLIQRYLKNDAMAKLLSAAVVNGVGKIQATATDLVTKNLPTIKISDPRLAAGVQYVIDHAPEAVEHFGLTRDRIADKLVAKIGLGVGLNTVTNEPKP